MEGSRKENGTSCLGNLLNEIWSVRNKVVFEGKAWNIQEILHVANMRTFETLNVVQVMRSTRDRTERRLTLGGLGLSKLSSRQHEHDSKSLTHQQT